VPQQRESRGQHRAPASGGIDQESEQHRVQDVDQQQRCKYLQQFGHRFNVRRDGSGSDVDQYGSSRADGLCATRVDFEVCLQITGLESGTVPWGNRQGVEGEEKK